MRSQAELETEGINAEPVRPPSGEGSHVRQNVGYQHQRLHAHAVTCVGKTGCNPASRRVSRATHLPVGNPAARWLVRRLAAEYHFSPYQAPIAQLVEQMTLNH